MQPGLVHLADCFEENLLFKCYHTGRQNRIVVPLNLRHNFGYSLLKSGQTNFGQSLDVKSNLCPMSVKTLSNTCPCTGSVNTLSTRGTMSVKGLSKRAKFGQILYMKIQGLSRFFADHLRSDQNFLIRKSLDKLKTWTEFGH